MVESEIDTHRQKLDLQTSEFGFVFCFSTVTITVPTPPNTTTQLPFYLPEALLFPILPDAHLDISLSAVLPEVPA